MKVGLLILSVIALRYAYEDAAAHVELASILSASWCVGDVPSGERIGAIGKNHCASCIIVLTASMTLTLLMVQAALKYAYPFFATRRESRAAYP